MPSVQTTYSETIAAAQAGMPADAAFKADTRTVETVAGIAPGLAIGQGSAAKGAILGAAAATGFAGVGIRAQANLNSTTPDTIARYDDISVMTQGDIWVTVGGNVTAGQDVTFNTTTGVLSTIAADASNFTIAGARWMTSASSGALAILRLNGIAAA
jgi:hypothetical protein